jgi:arsenite methyltransferase
MTVRAATAKDVLRRARAALKRFAYSGFGRDRWQQPDRVVAELGLRPGDRVADIGAGGGYFTFRLARAVGPTGVVYAVDTDRDLPQALAAEAAGQGLANVVAVRADPDDPGLPEPVDLGFLVNAYHHLPDRQAWFARLAGQVKPGGRVAVVEARPSAGLLRVFGHATPPGTIRSEVEAAGWAVVAEHAFLPRQSFLVFERPAGRSTASRPAREPP